MVVEHQTQQRSLKLEPRYSPVLSARSDHELGKCAARLGVTGATKWSVLWAVAEADAGGDPHVEEE